MIGYNLIIIIFLNKVESKFYLRFSEQGKSGPGFPLIVCASDIFGGNPIWFPCVSTASTSLCHHSPVNKFYHK